MPNGMICCGVLAQVSSNESVSKPVGTAAKERI
jgi:hypothetical protein